MKLDWRLLIMKFPERLVSLRKKRGLNQKEFSQLLGMHVTQVRRYEKGTSQPTLDVLIKMAKVLSVSADALLFGDNSRGPSEELKLQFEAISRLDDREKQFITAVLDGLIIRYEAKRWSLNA